MDLRGTCAGPQGQPYELVLFRAGDVPIQRHVKIKGAANPYDPQWAVYFEARLGVKMTHTLKGRRQLLYLWETPTRSLSCLPPKDHQTHGMAQPSCDLADAWGQGYHRQPCPPAPQLPQAGP